MTTSLFNLLRPSVEELTDVEAIECLLGLSITDSTLVLTSTNEVTLAKQGLEAWKIPYKPLKKQTQS